VAAALRATDRSAAAPRLKAAAESPRPRAVEDSGSVPGPRVPAAESAGAIRAVAVDWPAAAIDFPSLALA